MCVFFLNLAIVKSEIELWLLVGPPNISFHKYNYSYVYFGIIQSIPSYGIEKNVLTIVQKK